MDYTVHGVTKSWTGLDDFHFSLLTFLHGILFPFKLCILENEFILNGALSIKILQSLSFR